MLTISHPLFCVLEQNPPKQGLKPAGIDNPTTTQLGFRAKSTKTRIETSGQYWED